jgi:hypothetical protein
LYPARGGDLPDSNFKVFGVSCPLNPRTLEPLELLGR